MPVKIASVARRSPAARAGIEAGDVLLTVNGHEISDVLDYMFYCAEDRVELAIESGGKTHRRVIYKSEYDDIGLEFDTFLMDSKQSCRNKCIFCFIDQMPPGMRETLYFKDDDARLSFLQGNYVTLTNLTDKDIQRIIDMRLNINVSVHTTDPELRCRMMNNRFAGEKLKYLKMMTDAGLELNCQIVCCPGINDGAELERTLSDLGELMPNIRSTAVVPVGLTAYREGLYPLKAFDRESAGAVIDVIAAFQESFLKKYGTRMAYAADEFFLTAEREIPDAEYYEDYPQYENGVGLLRSLYDEVCGALDEYDECEDSLSRIRRVTVAEDFHKKLAELIMKRFPDVRIKVRGIRNRFFGETITVAGLVTAGDLTDQLRGEDIGDELLIPKVMLKADEPVFLDDLTVGDVEKALGTRVVAVANDGYEYVRKVLGIEER